MARIGIWRGAAVVAVCMGTTLVGPTGAMALRIRSATTTTTHKCARCVAPPQPSTVSAASAVTKHTGLGVDPTGRYLMRGGSPFLIVGDSPQGMIVNAGNASGNPATDARNYFSTRRSQGFNTLWINVLADGYTGGSGTDGTQGAVTANYGDTYDGINPFTSTLAGGQYDLTTPNASYWSRVDTILSLAKKYGFVVFLDPIETGGWLDTIKANGQGTSSGSYQYGQWLGNRYKSYPNIVWLSGNDYNYNTTDDPYVQTVAEGIRSTDPSALQTIEFFYTAPSSSLSDASWRSLIDIDGTYTYPTGGSIAWTYDTILNDYNRSDHLPTFLMESDYENENGVTEHGLRAQAWWAVTSGATGQFFGEHNTWQLAPGWQNFLNTTGATEMTHLVSLFSTREWYSLVPDDLPGQQRTLVTAGGGSYDSDSYVTAASTPDGKLGVAYLPSGGTITVQLGGFSGPVTARWYDPTSGTFTSIAGSPLANAGSQSFTSPGANGDGDPDWVLLLEASGKKIH